MSTVPRVSVVMGVYNEVATLPRSLDSILRQDGVDLEFIVVNDGSTDGTSDIFRQYAQRDERIRVVEQTNTGLTKALIKGCSLARGDYIARQDAGGDVSYSGRLAQQAAILDAHPSAAMVSCGTRFLGPRGEFLYDVTHQDDELERALIARDPNRLSGPSSHPSVVMRRTTYEQVGGYRPEFRVAQDLDLWVRLVEHGTCLAIPEVLYETVLQPGSISHVKRPQQVAAARAIVESRALRQEGQADDAMLECLQRDFDRLDRISRRTAKTIAQANFFYFIGSVLTNSDPKAARGYFAQVLRIWPLYFKAIYKYLRAW